MTDKEKEQICRWWVNHELRSNRVTFSDKVYVSTADIQDFEQFIDSLVEDSLSDKTEKTVDELSTNVANGLMEQLKESMPERPTFKVGQKITDGKETVIVSELLDDGSIRVDTKPSGDCWFDIDVNEADKWRLVEEPISEDLLDEIHNRWEDDPHTKWPKCPYKDFKNIACHFANWQKEQYINEGISPKDAYFGHLLEESWANGRLSGIHEHKQQMIKDAKLSGWVARDDDGHLHLFEAKPRRIEGNHRWWDRDYHSTTLNNKDFPNLKWEDEPIYVKLPIIVED